MKTILPILIMISLISCGHKLNSKVEEAVNKVSKEKVVYYAWETQNEAFQNLYKEASLEDLLYLTENENVYVRYYAFIGLRERKYFKIIDIYNKHKNDFEEISTSNGACLSGSNEIRTLMLMALNPENPKYKWLTQTEYDKLWKEQFK
jgi:lipopolysaccharide export LptBFGC system permease protein LptF